MPRLKTLCLAGIAAFSLTGCSDMEDYANPEAAFRATFGVPSSAAISGLQGCGTSVRDSSFCYLRFQAHFADVRELVGGSFSPITFADFKRRTSGAKISAPRPTWWAPPVGGTTQFYTSSAFHPSFTRGKAFLAYDPSAEVAYLYWDGND